MLVQTETKTKNTSLVVYTVKSCIGATRKAIGRRGVYFCSPPLGDEQISERPSLLEGYGLIIFNLHGLPYEPCWYGDGGKAALRKSTLETLDLSGSGIFALNCHLGDPHQPLFKSLCKAGVAYVVAGEGPNYGGTIKPVGATVLVGWFVSFIAGMEPEKALKWAKIMTSVFAPKGSKQTMRALKDALKFKLWEL